MNVKIDTNELRRELDNLSSNILEYEKNYKGLLDEIKRIDDYFQDDPNDNINVKETFKKTYTDDEPRKEMEVVSLLKEFESLYEDIYEKYNNIERK